MVFRAGSTDAPAARGIIVFLSPPAGSASLKPEMHRGILQHIQRRHNELSLKETWLELGMENSQSVHIVKKNQNMTYI
jgi:hypothetical protein